MMHLSNEPNCASTDPEIFFTEDRGGYKHLPKLKQICGACYAQAECLEYAVQNAVVGYWGNATEKQRTRIRQARKIVASPILVEGAA
jgi:hypothetical protein